MLVQSVVDSVSFSAEGRKGRADCAAGSTEKGLWVCQSKAVLGGVQL